MLKLVNQPSKIKYIISINFCKKESISKNLSIDTHKMHIYNKEFPIFMTKFLSDYIILCTCLWFLCYSVSNTWIYIHEKLSRKLCYHNKLNFLMTRKIELTKSVIDNKAVFLSPLVVKMRVFERRNFPAFAISNFKLSGGSMQKEERENHAHKHHEWWWSAEDHVQRITVTH